MKHKNPYVVCLITLICIAINIIGKKAAAFYELPVWFDCFGTALIAYIYGPFCGMVVGLASNISVSMADPEFMLYALVNAAVGIVVGICTKRKMFDTLFGIVTTGVAAAVSAVFISLPLNILLTDGYTGNKWGDGVIDFLESFHINSMVRFIIGEFYVDFVDKVSSVVIIGLIIRTYNKYWSKIIEKISEKNSRKAASVVISVLIGASAAAGIMPMRAEASRLPDYDSYLQTVYNSENGLPSGTANDVTQTKDGVLWIGTYGGLYRYTGNEFRWMNNYSSIKNVNCFLNDNEGRLWVGTNDGGLSIIINNEVTNVLTEKEGLPSDSVRCIVQGAGGSYLIGTTGGLAVVSLSNGLAVETVIPDISYTRSIAYYKGETAVVTDDGQLIILSNNRIAQVNTCNLSGEHFVCCGFDNDGRLYLGTSGSTVQRFTYQHGWFGLDAELNCGKLTHINSLNLTETGEIILCSDSGAGYLDRAGVVHEINTGAFNSSIEHILFDYQGNLWFTSSRLGLLKLCHSPFTEIYSTLGMEEKVVNSIIKWQNAIYFGTDSGLDMVNSQMTRQIYSDLTRDLKDVRVRCLKEDSNGSLWICTSGKGIIRIDPDGKKTCFSSGRGTLGDKFRTVIEMSNGTIAVAGDSGITFIKDNAVTGCIGSFNGLDNPRVLCLTETKEGELLAGTDGNGIAVIRNGIVAETLKKDNGLTSGVVMRIIYDKDSGKYIVVTGNSLCSLTRRGDSFDIQVLNNFPYFNNFDVQERDDGMLFVTSSAGVYVVSKEKLLQGERIDSVLLDYSKGLRISPTANSWNYIDEYQNLYFAADSGAVRFNMYNYMTNLRSYRMGLENILVDGKSYPVTDSEAINIPKGSDVIVFSPDIVNYSTSDPFIRVMLEGYDTEPKIMPLSELEDSIYTNLPTGSYTYRISVLDESGMPLAENTYTIIKEREMYDTRRFRIYFIGVIVLTVFYFTWLLFKLRIRRTLERQRKDLEHAQKQVEMANEAIMTIARTVDAKDVNTSEHSFRVSEYAVMIARRYGYNEEQCEELRRTALLHDIGKIGIPDNVLNKPGRLTDEEYAIMKTHVVKGAEILKNFTSIKNIVEGAQFHHERYDGRGYVQGLKGEEIPINARIIGIADAFDAMTANRVYRKQLDFDFVVEELRKNRGTQFDPQLTDIMLELIDDGTIEVEKLYHQSKKRSERSDSK